MIPAVPTYLNSYATLGHFLSVFLTSDLLLSEIIKKCTDIGNLRQNEKCFLEDLGRSVVVLLYCIVKKITRH